MTIGKVDRVQEPQVLGTILGDVGFDGNRIPDVEHGLEHAGSSQGSRRAALKRVRCDGAVFVLHVGVYICVWVDPFDFRNCGLDGKRFRAIKLPVTEWCASTGTAESKARA